MLTRETLTGPWAGLPVAWTDDNCFDEEIYRADVIQCCRANIPGVYTGGTTGEFYAMEFDEFKRVAAATVESCHESETPAMIGCSSTYTLGAIRRAKYAAELGADAIQVALPFWMEMGDVQIIDFFKEVSASCGDLPISIYETTRAKRCLTLEQHRAIHDVVHNYLMVKSNEGTLGCTPEGCLALSQFVNVFVGEHKWATLGPQGACGSCSSMVYWNPDVILTFWSEVECCNWPAVNMWCERIENLFQFLHKEFGSKGFTDTAFDRMGGIANEFLKTNLQGRKPYPSATVDDVTTLKNWYLQHFPEMLYRK